MTDRPPLRILQFGRFADESLGGVGRVVESLVRALEGRAECVNLVADVGLPPVGEDWPCRIVRAKSLGMFASTPICPGMPLIARRLHREYRFQIAHLHLPDPMSHMASLALPDQVKVVITWHSDIIRQKGLLRLYRPLLRRLAARASVIMAPTPLHFSSMPQLAALSRPEQRVVVPFGFDLSAYLKPHAKTTEVRRRYGERMIFALGRHVYYKGFEYLVRALKHVPRATLVLGGAGPLTPDLMAAAARFGLRERVHFPGWIPESDLPAYYQACDVFCLPSVEPAEAFGIVQIEAMACGRPVVCCELGNGVTWVNQDGKTGLVVPPRNPGALAAALTRLLDDPTLREALGRRAAERAVREFSLDALRDKTLAVYQRVAGI